VQTIKSWQRAPIAYSHVYVFLSHSSLNSKDVLGLCRVLLRRYGLAVYVDLDDKESAARHDPKQPSVRRRAPFGILRGR
jgi:hypothetical protein